MCCCSANVPVICSWLRVILIYVLSGIGGYLVSGIFDATSLSVSYIIRVLSMVILTYTVSVQCVICDV